MDSNSGDQVTQPEESQGPNVKRLESLLGLTNDPQFVVLNYSDRPAVMLVSALLRRMWLLNPESDAVKVDENTSDADLSSKFRSCMNPIHDYLHKVGPPNSWDDNLWRSSTYFTLLDPPFAISGPDLAVGSKLSVQNRWRKRIYYQYNHVFFDMYNVRKSSGEDIDEFKPPNTSVWELEPPSPGKTFSEKLIRSESDTFVCPIWAPPGSKLSVSIDNECFAWSPDEQPWTEVVWLKAWQTITLRLEAKDSKQNLPVGAALAVGTCSSRPVLDVKKHSYPPKEGEKGSPAGYFNKNKLAFYPEATILARGIFLQAGDSIESCNFDEEHQVDDQLKPVEPKPPGTVPELYRPIFTERSTRLLLVEPGAPGEDLRTSLKIIDLDDPPAYAAISYTWGNPSDKVPFQCGGSTVLIPSNLEKALKRIRHHDLRQYVWADAICINQEDLHERSQQVSIMRQIFQKADRVLAWLGVDDNMQAVKAFAAVCHIVKSWKASLGEDKLSYLSYEGAFEPLNTEETHELQQSLSKESWIALYDMFEARLFRRFWIIQELALSRKTLVVWGDHHIEWGLVGVCSAWLLTKGWSFNCKPVDSASIPPSVTPGPGHAHAAAAYNAFLMYVLPLAGRSGISSFSPLDFSVFLGTTIGLFQSTDPRDRLYALLGLRFAGNDPDKELLVCPDYSKDVEGLYTEASRGILLQDKHLRLLSAVQHGQEGVDPNLPSWVPRWDQPHQLEPFALREEQGYYANGGEVFCPDDETFGEDGKSLFLNGLLCGTINTTSSETLDISHFDKSPGSLSTKAVHEAVTFIFTQLRDINRQFRSSWSDDIEQFTLEGFSNPETQEEMFKKGVRKAVALSQPGKYGMRKSSEIITGESPQADHLGELLMYWRERSTWRTTLGHLQDQCEVEYPQELLDSQGTIHLELMLSSINVLLGRRVFQYDDDKVGVGPAAMQEGDKVVVLFGGIVPYVLRPLKDDRWQFLGECFMPGLMQGEAVEEAGLLAPGSYSRTENGNLSLKLDGPGESPRFHRKVGEHGVKRFEIR